MLVGSGSFVAASLLRWAVTAFLTLGERLQHHFGPGVGQNPAATGNAKIGVDGIGCGRVQLRSTKELGKAFVCATVAIVLCAVYV